MSIKKVYAPIHIPVQSDIIKILLNSELTCGKKYLRQIAVFPTMANAGKWLMNKDHGKAVIIANCPE